MGKRGPQSRFDLAEITKLKEEGLSNGEIARRMGTSPQNIGKLIRANAETVSAPSEETVSTKETVSVVDVIAAGIGPRKRRPPRNPAVKKLEERIAELESRLSGTEPERSSPIRDQIKSVMGEFEALTYAQIGLRIGKSASQVKNLINATSGHFIKLHEVNHSKLTRVRIMKAADRDSQ